MLTGWNPWNPALLERISAGEELTLADHVRRGFWWAGLVNLIGLVVLIATVRWWVGPTESSGVLPRENEEHQVSAKWRRGLTLVAVGIAALHAVPRMDLGLWDDEESSLRFHIQGFWTRDEQRFEDLRPFFLKTSIRDTFWSYPNTNNHFLYTALTTAVHRTWQATTGKRSWEFSEPVLRIVPLLAGLLSIPVWVRVFGRLGFARSGLVGAFFLSVHPWFIRYISEGRGYALVFLFLGLSLLAAHRALTTGSWRSWLGYGAAQFFLLYSWPGMAIHAVWLNLVLGGTILVQSRGTERFRPQFTRWAIVNLLAVMALFQMVAPCMPQIGEYIEGAQRKIPVGGTWLANLFGYLTSGMETLSFYKEDSFNPRYVTLERIAHKWSVLVYGVVGVVAVFAVIGLACLVRQRGFSRVMVAALAVPPLVVYGYGWASGNYLFPWYYCYLVPVVAGLTGMGIDRSARKIPERVLPHAWATAVLAVGFLSVYFVCVLPKLNVLIMHDVDPQEESVLLTRDTSSSLAHDKILTAHIHFEALTYDPHGFWVEAGHSDDPIKPGLTRLMRISDQFDLPLFVNLGFPEDARLLKPQLMALVDNEDMFEKVDTLWALEPQLVREVYRYKGGVFDIFKDL